MTPEQLLLIAQAKRKRAEAEAKAAGQPAPVQPAAPKPAPPLRMSQTQASARLREMGIDPQAVLDDFRGTPRRDSYGELIPTWRDRPAPFDPLAPKDAPKPPQKPKALWEEPEYRPNVAEMLDSNLDKQLRNTFGSNMGTVGPRTPDPTKASIEEQRQRAQTFDRGRPTTPSDRYALKGEIFDKARAGINNVLGSDVVQDLTAPIGANENLRTIVAAPLNFGQGFGKALESTSNNVLGVGTDALNSALNLADPKREQFERPRTGLFDQNALLDEGGALNTDAAIIPQLAGQYYGGRMLFGKGKDLFDDVAKWAATSALVTPADAPKLADMVPKGTPFGDFVSPMQSTPGESTISGMMKNLGDSLLLDSIAGGVLGGVSKASSALSPKAPMATNAGIQAPRIRAPNPDLSPLAAQDIRSIMARDGAEGAEVVSPYAPPPQAPTQPTAQAAPQPSVAPVVPPNVAQGAPRTAQAGPAGAGQQPPVSPPTLNAVPTTPAVPKQQMLVARDTAKILTRIMRAANVKNADIRGYLPGAVQRYKSLNDSRVPFAFFLEGDLPKHFAEPVAADVVTKLQGWGRARNAAMGTGDKSAQITQGTIKELRGSQQDFLTKSAEANLYKGSLISQEDQILKSLRETGRKGYEPSLDYARQAIDGRRKPSAAEAQAVDDLRQILARPTLQKYVDDATRIRAEKDGIDIDQMIKDDPIGSAHWLQSEFRRLSDASEDALTGKPTRTSGAYDDLREMILDPLKRASPGYEGAMMRFGHDFGSKEAVTFGKGIFTASRGAYDTAQKIRKFKKLGRRQQTVAWKSIRDEFLNEFRGTPEDAAAKLTRMQQEGALDLLEQMGARGKRFADDIRRIAQQENPSIRAIEQASNSLTFKNLSGAEAAREMVQSPINQVVGSVTDKASWPMTLAADAMVMGTTGIPAPMLTASKLMDKFGNPGPKTLSRATEGLYGLPSKASGSTPELLKASRGGGGGRPKGGAPQVEQDIGALLKALDEVEADPKRRGGPEGKRLLNQIAAAQGGKPAKPKRQKVTAAPATGLGGPASPASASPDATGLGTSSAKPPAKNGVNNIIAGGVAGSAIGTFGAGDAEAQEDLTGKITETEQTIADLKKAMTDLDKITDPFEKQRQLKAAGYYAGKIDGNIAGKTTDGMVQLRAKREADLKKAEDELKDLVRRDALQSNRPDPLMMALREYGPAVLGIGALFGMKYMRGGAAKASIKTAEAASNKLNKLITKGPVTGAMNKRDENRFSNLNKLWQKGGASKDELPFKQDSVGNYKPNAKAKLPEELFADSGVWQTVTKYVKGKDVAIILGGGLDVAIAQPFIDKANENLTKAEAAWNDTPSDETAKALEDAKNEVAAYTLLQRIGMGVAAGRVLGTFGGAYAKPMPNIPGAASEQAKLKQFIAGRKPPPKPRTPRRPTPPQPTPAGPTTGLGGPTQLPLPLKGGGKKKP